MARDYPLWDNGRMSSPHGFQDLSTTSALLWVRDGLAFAEHSANLLEQGVEYLEEISTPMHDGGRGGVRLIQFGERRGIWRQNLHGGMIGNLLGPRFPSPDRLTEEVYLSESLLANQMPTPPVLLAFAQRRAGFWHQHLITEEVPGAITVFEGREEPNALQAGRALMEELFQLGFWAKDMHPGNMLWQAEENRAWIIDLADACLLGRPLTTVEAKARMARYRRYFRKHAGEVPSGA